MEHEQQLSDRLFDLVAALAFIAGAFVIGHSLVAFASGNEPYFSPIRVELVKE